MSSFLLMMVLKFTRNRLETLIMKNGINIWILAKLSLIFSPGKTIKMFAFYYRQLVAMIKIRWKFEICRLWQMLSLLHMGSMKLPILQLIRLIRMSTGHKSRVIDFSFTTLFIELWSNWSNNDVISCIMTFFTKLMTSWMIFWPNYDVIFSLLSFY